MTRAQLPSRALFRPGFFQVFHDRLELIGRGGEIKKPIAARAAFLVDLVEALGQFLVAPLVAEFALVIEKRLGEAVPDFVAHRLPGKLAGRFFLFLAEFVVRFRAAREADHRQGRRQLAIGRDVVERGHELAMSQVAGRAKNHDRARLRHGFGRESFAQGIGLLLARHDVVLSDGSHNLRRSMRAR